PATPQASYPPHLASRGAVLVVVAALLGGTWYWQTGRFLVKTDDAYVQGDITVLGPRIEADIATIHVADNQG
ncbi:MAG: hemolysin, partial [Roseomonas sp.]|nr:hemolysin [Roseomonas sp.]